MSFVRTTVKTRFDPLPYNNQSKKEEVRVRSETQGWSRRTLVTLPSLSSRRGPMRRVGDVKSLEGGNARRQELCSSEIVLNRLTGVRCPPRALAKEQQVGRSSLALESAR